MAVTSQGAIQEMAALMEQADEPLKVTFQNMHQGYPMATLLRFLKAREWSASKAHKMLMDCLNWRIQNHIDDILCKPIIPADLYRGVRDSQLVGLSGYTKEGLPVFALGIGLSTFDKAWVNYYVQSHIQINEYRDRVILPAATKKHGRHIGKCVKVLDMSGLKLSALSHLKILTMFSTIDDLNYPEKTQTYYIVNAPYVFAACWKVVKPLLQERTRRKVQVLHGCGRDELLKIMDYASLPHFCQSERNGSSSRVASAGAGACYSLDHPFHQQLYSHIKNNVPSRGYALLPKQGSMHVDVATGGTEGTKIAETIQSELHLIGDDGKLASSLSGLRVDVA